MDEELTRQLQFLREIDRLKTVVRQSPLLDKSRKENSAEHSWHLAMFAWVLAGSADATIDQSRVIRMLLLHDIVEVDAGDTPLHGSGSKADQAAREEQAANRIFGLLPEQQGSEFLALWCEFEAGETADARFAKALDRFQPLLANLIAGGGTWSESGVGYEQVIDRYGPAIRDGSPALWSIAERLVAGHFGRA